MQGVMEQLPLLDTAQLEELCAHIKLDVASPKKGKKRPLMNLVLRHLTSEEVEISGDGGEAVLLAVDGYLGRMLKGKKMKTETETEASGTGSKDGDSSVIDAEVKPKMELLKSLKLRDFKIIGQVGDKEGCMDYMSLSYQMQEAKAIGYSPKEIMSGVIKAIKTGSSLRRYFESKPDLTEDNFMKILRSHYNVEDSTTLFNKMANAAQEPYETEVNFVLRMMDLRNNIITLSKEENCPFEETLVRKKFFHSLAVGFKKDTIRLDLRTVLKDHDQEDDELLKEVSAVTARDNEHKRKLKSNKTAVNSLNYVGEDMEKKVQKTDAGMMQSRTSSGENPMMMEIKQLTAKVNEIGKLTTKVNELTTGYQKLKEQMSNGAVCQSNGQTTYPDNNRSSRRKFIKCKNCEEKNLFCSHCSVCGAGDHKRKDCTKNM